MTVCEARATVYFTTSVRGDQVTVAHVGGAQALGDAIQDHQSLALGWLEHAQEGIQVVGSARR